MNTCVYEYVLEIELFNISKPLRAQIIQRLKYRISVQTLFKARNIETLNRLNIAFNRTSFEECNKIM